MAHGDAQPPQSSTRSAFREAEKIFQLKRARRANGRRKPPADGDAEADLLRTVLDFREGAAGACASAGVSYCVDSALPGQRIYTLAAHPGLAVLPGALTAAEQRRIVRDALTAFVEAPNCTNHSAHAGPLSGLWEASLQVLVRVPCDKRSAAPGIGHGGHLAEQKARYTAANSSRTGCAQAAAPAANGPVADGSEAGCPVVGTACWSADGDGVPAKQLLRRLRWATLGPQYDWTRRQYGSAVAVPPLPLYLRDLAVRAADAAARAVARLGCAGFGSGLGLGSGSGYEPNAALVNFYSSESDTLCGHQDDAEGALEQPLVSASVGCDAIFLVGGATRDVPPTALLLRSGDVVVMSGLARAAFHGVPRVLLSRPAEHLQSGAYSPAFTDAEGSSSCPAISDSAGGGAEDDTMLDTALAEFISKARINVSIRQVVSDGPDAART